MAHDKKAKGGKIMFVLVRGMGQAFTTDGRARRRAARGPRRLSRAAAADASPEDPAMTTTLIITGIAIVVLLAISGFFSGSETALTAVSRGRMHQLEKDGSRAARDVNLLVADRENLIGTILLGNTFINILVSSLATAVLSAILGDNAVAITTGVMTVLILVFAEVLPKTLAIAQTDRFALAVARVLAAGRGGARPDRARGAVRRLAGAAAVRRQPGGQRLHRAGP